MRVTAVTGCCTPAYGEDDSMVVTEGFVSVALTANINTPDEIVVTNAAGKTCVRDAPCPEFQSYNVELTFCEVSPCLFSIVTGQPSVVDGAGNVIGFRMNSDTTVCGADARNFALEVWMGVPGVECLGQAGAFGYLLLPCLQGGVIGDFTVENAAITFTVTGAVTKDGNGWGVGPYDVVDDGSGGAGPLADPLDANDHLVALFTTVAPPEETDGCTTVPTPTGVATGATAGAPGTWTPSGSVAPASVAALIAGSPVTVVASPGGATAWTTGQYVQTLTAGPTGQAHWGGTSAGWVSGPA